MSIRCPVSDRDNCSYHAAFRDCNAKLSRHDDSTPALTAMDEGPHGPSNQHPRCRVSHHLRNTNALTALTLRLRRLRQVGLVEQPAVMKPTRSEPKAAQGADSGTDPCT